MKLVDERIEEYCIKKSSPVTAVCNDIADYTKANVPLPQMLIGPLESAVLGTLLRSINAKTVVEIGTYTGYSALAMASHIAEDAIVHTLDVNTKTTELAQSYWDKSEHGKKIKAHNGQGLDILPSIEGEFDFVFIDADKRNYLNYLNICLEKLSKNGMIVIDNTLWSGRVLDDNDTEKATLGIKEVNDYLEKRQDLHKCLLPVRDGMYIIQKL